MHRRSRRIPAKYLKLAERLAEHLHSEWRNTKTGWIKNMAGGWSLPETSTKDVIKNWLKIHHIQFKGPYSGVYRHTFILDRVVLKVPQYFGIEEFSTIRKETKNINLIRKTSVGRHFPVTDGVKYKQVYIQIQEYIPHPTTTKNDKRLKNLFRNYSECAANLGEQLGIGDIHSWNFGWFGKQGSEYPIFFDVETWDIPDRKSLNTISPFQLMTNHKFANFNRSRRTYSKSRPLFFGDIRAYSL